MKNILIATDGSEAAGDALDVAIEIAKQAGAELQVLSVRPLTPVGRAGVGSPILEVEQDEGATHISEDAAGKARAAGVEAKAHVAHGDVVASIAEAATLFGVDLLVVGSRGHGPLTGAVLGSVSHALVQQSPVPVTIVRHAAVHAAG
jgi:nucleotide-binding universal stress UspA family protein